MLTFTLLPLLGLVIGAALYVRLAPIGADNLVAMPNTTVVGATPSLGGYRVVIPLPNETQLAQLRSAIRATARTTEHVNSTPEHQIFVTRSATWGFPDVTHVFERDGLLIVSGHLVFGRSDLGVNGRRIIGWLVAAGIEMPKPA